MMNNITIASKISDQVKAKVLNIDIECVIVDIIHYDTHIMFEVKIIKSSDDFFKVDDIINISNIAINEMKFTNEED